MWEIIAPSEAWAVVQGESTGQTQVAVSEVRNEVGKCQQVIFTLNGIGWNCRVMIWRNVNGIIR